MLIFHPIAAHGSTLTQTGVLAVRRNAALNKIPQFGCCGHTFFTVTKLAEQNRQSKFLCHVWFEQP